MVSEDISNSCMAALSGQRISIKIEMKKLSKDSSELPEVEFNKNLNVQKSASCLAKFSNFLRESRARESKQK